MTVRDEPPPAMARRHEPGSASLFWIANFSEEKTNLLAMLALKSAY